ncbi:hypothetical protein JAAARDRAFT_204849 [Jaapia argillacea MUCL 33604]|uniref:Uncharacterized protein n=1 Tax=Jaapia argillacea MUCL 33604 TaxID=933084 RepID=A0A067Q4J5_9AGAM|nr:hypothetical protein JAAARDRAFT_204849 [Jaapia argillacea MUCL 33604]
MPAVRNLNPGNTPRQPPQLIKRPEGQNRFNVRNVLELSKPEWEVLSHRIQELAKKHLDLSVTYRYQDPEARDKFLQEAMKQEPIFSKFEDGWPLRYYVKDRWLAYKVNYAKKVANRRSRGPRSRRAKANVKNGDVEDEEEEELEYVDEDSQAGGVSGENRASSLPVSRSFDFQENPTLDSRDPSTRTRTMLPRNAKTRSLLRRTERDHDDSPDPPESSARRQPSPLPPRPSRMTFPARTPASCPLAQSLPTSTRTSSTSRSPAKINTTTSSPLNEFLSSFIKPSPSLAKTFETYGIKSFEDWDQFVHKPKAERDEVLMKFVFVGFISLFQYQTLIFELEKLSGTCLVPR